MTGPVIVRSGEGWEIVNEDGLIYKRRKKEPNPASEVLKVPIQPQSDIRWRHKRKKAALQQLKARYLVEIDEWEKLFQKLEKPTESVVFPNEATNSVALQDSMVDVSEKKFETVVEKLSCQVEQLEMFMEELKTLCCDVEYICKRPDEYGEFYRQIKSPRLWVEAIESSSEVLFGEPYLLKKEDTL